MNLVEKLWHLWLQLDKSTKYFKYIDPSKLNIFERQNNSNMKIKTLLIPEFSEPNFLKKW